MYSCINYQPSPQQLVHYSSKVYTLIRKSYNNVHPPATMSFLHFLARTENECSFKFSLLKQAKLGRRPKRPQKCVNFFCAYTVRPQDYGHKTATNTSKGGLKEALGGQKLTV